MTHQGKGNSRALIKRSIYKVEASSLEVSITSWTKRVYNPSIIKEVYKARRRALHKGSYKKQQIEAEPTPSYKPSSRYHHQESPLEEGNLKNIKILGRQAIKSSRRKQIHYISKSIK